MMYYSRASSLSDRIIAVWELQQQQQYWLEWAIRRRCCNVELTQQEGDCSDERGVGLVPGEHPLVVPVEGPMLV